MLDRDGDDILHPFKHYCVEMAEKNVSHVATTIKRNWRASNDEKLCAEERKFIFIIAVRFIRPGFIAKSNSVRKKNRLA